MRAPYDKPAPGAYGEALAESKKLPKSGAVAGTAGRWDLRPAGTLKVQFRFTSDQLLQLEGTYVDDVKIAR